MNEINWLKNDVELEPNDEKYELDKTVLNILNVDVSDAGKYTCRVLVTTSTNQQIEMSKTIDVRVVNRNAPVDCDDTSSHTHCKLVVMKGLCSKWGKFCCKSCRQAGYTIKF
jgi:hypothetical protein